MIARIWRGVTKESKADEFFDYMLKTGVKDLRATEGNLGALVLRHVDEGHADFLLISLWKSLDHIRRFAGDDIDKAVYYSEDKKYLDKLEPKVVHYDVLVGLEQFVDDDETAGDSAAGT